jgi:hypothetical protein
MPTPPATTNEPVTVDVDCVAVVNTMLAAVIVELAFIPLVNNVPF